MTDAAVTNTFTEKTKAKASEVNENFQDLVDFLNSTGVATVQDGDYGALVAASNLFSLRYQEDAASGNLTIGASAADIPGAAITVADGGTYVAIGIFDFLCEAGASPGATCVASGFLVVNGSTQTGAAQFSTESSITGVSTSGRATVTQFWVITPSTGHVVKLQASRVDGVATGAATANAGNTKLILVGLA